MNSLDSKSFVHHGVLSVLLDYIIHEIMLVAIKME